MTDAGARKPHILVVDDTEGNRYAVSRLLRGAGMDVSEAATGEDALAKAQMCPDLVVLDINLPDIMGYEVLRQLKSAPETSFIPVMHLTASYVDAADQVYGLDAGADAYLTHPIDPAVFLATVRALLRVGEADAKLRAAATERERLLEAAEAARAEAVAANSAKSAFLATMSHELRTPLNAIGGYVELVELGVRGPVTDGQREYLRRIAKSSHVLLSLINDILNFAKLEAGTVEFRSVDTDVDPLLKGVATLVEPQLRAKELRYVYDPCDTALRFHGDPERVEQILLNLLTNAIKFTEPGGTISLSCDTTDLMVMVKVADTGRGIPVDKLEAIFDPFVQIDRQLTDGTPQGTGLGLSIARDLARRMFGDLRAEQRVGGGSVFALTLPRV